MPLYEWKGPGEMRQADLARATTPKLAKPVGPAAETVEGETHWVCTVKGCGRKFRKAMIAARHFNQSHEMLREDKDSWRDYTEEITE